MSNENPTIESLDEATRLRLERLQARRAANGSPSSPAPTRTGAPAKRRHPSERARMGALALSLATTGGLTYVFASETAGAATVGTTTAAAGVVTTNAVASTASTATTVTTATTATTAAPATTATTAATATTASAAAPATTTAAAATGTTTVNGAAYTNKYGTMQVQAVFDSTGKLVSVNVLAFPDGDNKSVSINNRALPTLNSEAVTAQSAKGVQSVSGATYTSTGYKQSLQSAIDSARAAGITTLV